MRESAADNRLIADIGGTNARFALHVAGSIVHERDFACADYPDIVTAIETYLLEVGAASGHARPVEAGIAIASAITGDIVSMTNNPWSFSATATRRNLGFRRLFVLNDFTALALSLPALPRAELEQVGGTQPVHGAPMALLGAGTGLGVSGLIPIADTFVPLQGEGGHVTLCATNEREQAVVDVLKRRFPHVSAERVLSGPGLINLHDALSTLAGVDAEALTPEDISRRGLNGSDPLCREVLHLFCAMFGTVAGNLALTLGAAGGVYIGGGIIPKLGPYFAASLFRERFAAKGRFAGYLEKIPAYVIRTARPAFIGLGRAFDSTSPRLEAQ